MHLKVPSTLFVVSGSQADPQVPAHSLDHNIHYHVYGCSIHFYSTWMDCFANRTCFVHFWQELGLARRDNSVPLGLGKQRIQEYQVDGMSRWVETAAWVLDVALKRHYYYL
jgi:hypothetical protein